MIFFFNFPKVFSQLEKKVLALQYSTGSKQVWFGSTPTMRSSNTGTLHVCELPYILNVCEECAATINSVVVDVATLAEEEEGFGSAARMSSSFASQSRGTDLNVWKPWNLLPGMPLNHFNEGPLLPVECRSCCIRYVADGAKDGGCDRWHFSGEMFPLLFLACFMHCIFFCLDFFSFSALFISVLFTPLPVSLLYYSLFG